MQHDRFAPNAEFLVWLTRSDNAKRATDVTRTHWIRKGIRSEYYDGWLRLARERAGVRQADLFGR